MDRAMGTAIPAVAPRQALFKEIAVSTNLSRFFRQRRLDLGLRYGDVARRMGYTSLAGACNKLIMFEDRGDIHADLFARLAAVLGVDQATIDTLIAQDRKEFLEAWTAWANEPIQPEICFRAIPGVFFGHPVPDHLKTTEEMEAYAQAFAKRSGKKTWLILSNKLRVYFDEDGTRRGVQEAAPGECNGPWMRLGRSRKKFILGGSSGMEPRMVHEPERRGPAGG
jgi:hypothetical protein